MAGVDTTLNGMTEDEFSKGYGIYLDYNDVDESSYYARALAWATKVDIAHGSNGAFRPNDTITREEFAALLSNYAMLNGKDVSVDADKVLAEFPDGSSVSDWAANAVAWAADADIMGNGGKLEPRQRHHPRRGRRYGRQLPAREDRQARQVIDRPDLARFARSLRGAGLREGSSQVSLPAGLKAKASCRTRLDEQRAPGEIRGPLHSHGHAKPYG